MTNQIGTPKGALIAVGDLLDHCAKVKSGQEVLILAEIEGLYGGDSTVDQEAISWVQTGVQARGANASVLWIDYKPEMHKWQIPPVAKAAMESCDILINFSFNIVTEEMIEFREHILNHNFRMVRNFATTAPLLCTAWAQTPHELVTEIRYQTSIPFVAGKSLLLTDPNGTHLEAKVLDSQKKEGFPGRGSTYTMRREEADGNYYPWPEWLHPPIQLADTNGVFIFESMLSWWSRYIGISPYFSKPVDLIIKDNRIAEIKGGEEADALRRFLDAMVERLGDGVYDFSSFHYGLHPQASVGPHQCPNPLIRRIIDHSHSRNLHFHIGAPSPIPEYKYWLHCTGDIRTPTLRVGDTLIYDKGHLTALDNPTVLAIEEKYPGRPGVEPVPKSF